MLESKLLKYGDSTGKINEEIEYESNTAMIPFRILKGRR
jgi:hypothetical protein